MRLGSETMAATMRRSMVPADTLPRVGMPALARRSSAGSSTLGACCLVGFWGVPNFGDEWLFRAAQEFLREISPGCGLSALVLSAAVEREQGRTSRPSTCWRVSSRTLPSSPACPGSCGRCAGRT